MLSLQLASGELASGEVALAGVAGARYEILLHHLAEACMQRSDGDALCKDVTQPDAEHKRHHAK